MQQDELAGRLRNALHDLCVNGYYRRLLETPLIETNRKKRKPTGHAYPPVEQQEAAWREEHDQVRKLIDTAIEAADVFKGKGNSHDPNAMQHFVRVELLAAGRFAMAVFWNRGNPQWGPSQWQLDFLPAPTPEERKQQLARLWRLRDTVESVLYATGRGSKSNLNPRHAPPSAEVEKVIQQLKQWEKKKWLPWSDARKAGWFERFGIKPGTLTRGVSDGKLEGTEKDGQENLYLVAEVAANPPWYKRIVNFLNKEGIKS